MEKLDIEIVQGSTFEWLIFIKDVNGNPLDMSGFTGGTAGARGMLRKSYADTLPIASFTVFIHNKTEILAAIASGLCHLTDADIASLEPDTSGKCYLLVRLTAAGAAAIPGGKYYYDLEIEDLTGFVFKPYGGAANVVFEVTK